MIVKGILFAIGLWLGYNVILPIIQATFYAVAIDFFENPGETILKIVLGVVGFLILVHIF